ncbi:MAG: ATP-binding protein [Planctomycetota bacterium]|nr:ATP-binding protein [Planctomycetota bacterium]
MGKATLNSHYKPGLALSVLICLGLVLVMGWLRLEVFAHSILPIGFGAPLVLIAWTRRRYLIWTAVAAFTAIAIWKLIRIHGILLESPPQTDQGRILHTAMVMVDMLLVALICHQLLRQHASLEDRTAELAERNNELSQRREEIARQNEELQSQTEELERQGEELRVSNNALESGQRILEALLDLSRSLKADMPRDRVFTTICQTMQLLIPSSAGAAIWERKGDRLRVSCHHGFGHAGPDLTDIEMRSAFGSLIIEHGRTGYIEDIATRPDLRIPQPKDGPRFKAVLAAPLRISSQTIGTLEVYSADARRWTDDEIGLVESLASQASTGMAAAELFGQIENEHRWLQTILETVPFGIAIVSDDGERVTMNPAGDKLLGIHSDRKDIRQLWRSIRKLYQNGAEIPENARPTVRALRGEQTGPDEIEIQIPGGRHAFILASAAPIYDRAGGINAAIMAFVDITAQKQLQQELDHRRRDAEEASTRKSRFLAAVSHDIRTPANAISLLAELIQRSASDPSMSDEIPELARELQRSSLNLVNLISDVLDLTRLDSGRVEIQNAEFSFNKWLVEECKQLQPLAEQKKLNFACSPPQRPLWLNSDRIKLSRVLTNLIGNAVKFTEEGSIHVAAELLPDGRPQIIVKDTGIGIPQEQIARIFDEFFQLKNPERDRNKGSGLGLSISRRLLEGMGGSITVESTLGEGSEFTVTLPASVVVV